MDIAGTMILSWAIGILSSAETEWDWAIIKCFVNIHIFSVFYLFLLVFLKL